MKIESLVTISWIPLAALLLYPGAIGAQEEGAVEPAVEPAVGPAVETTAGAEASEESPAASDEGFSPEVSETIRSLIAREEEALAGEGYGYDPGNRRDPFVPLGKGNGPEPLPCEDADELRCVPIDDVEITGVYMTAGEAVAQARGSESNRAFLLVAGDQLLDGEVVSVTLDRVVFRQRIDRPDLNLKPFREVVKELNP